MDRGLTLALATLTAFAACEGRGGSRPLYYERPITAEDLAGRSLTELSLMRNWVYARHGHPFRRAWLREFFAGQEWYEVAAAVRPEELSELDRANVEVVALYDLSLSRDDLRRRRAPLVSRDHLTEAERIELELLGERLGVWHGPGEADRATPLQDPSQLDDLLTIEKLDDLSRRDLKLLRNLVHARRGKPFESELLRLHFGRIEWYEADSTYTDARLTPVDRRNLTLIRSLEDEIGGPLSDEEERSWLIEA